MAKSLGRVWVEIQLRLQEQCVGYIIDTIHLVVKGGQKSSLRPFLQWALQLLKVNHIYNFLVKKSYTLLVNLVQKLNFNRPSWLMVVVCSRGMFDAYFMWTLSWRWIIVIELEVTNISEMLPRNFLAGKYIYKVKTFRVCKKYIFIDVNFKPEMNKII